MQLSRAGSAEGCHVTLDTIRRRFFCLWSYSSFLRLPCLVSTPPANLITAATYRRAYCNLRNSQIKRLQHIQNSLAIIIISSLLGRQRTPSQAHSRRSETIPTRQLAGEIRKRHVSCRPISQRQHAPAGDGQHCNMGCSE